MAESPSEAQRSADAAEKNELKAELPLEKTLAGKENEQQEVVAADEDDGGLTESFLDLTSCQLHDLDEVELPTHLTDLDLTANRLSVLDPRIGELAHLKKLSLRQNLLTDEALEPLFQWTGLSGLEELVLRDNKLTKIPRLNIFKNLLVFDISFNEISSLKGLSEVSPTLKELYVSKNKLTKIQELDHLRNLRILELGSNRLRVMEGLENLSMLQELWLGRNRIRAVEMCGLKSLVKISLQSNRLTSMLGFQDNTMLEELYLSHNGITKMEGLSTLVNLRVLDLAINRLDFIGDIGNLTRLEDLWLNENGIDSLDGLDVALAGSREKLTTIYLERNPCAKEPDYLSVLRRIFPNIEQIDSNTIEKCLD